MSNIGNTMKKRHQRGEKPEISTDNSQLEQNDEKGAPFDDY